MPRLPKRNPLATVDTRYRPPVNTGGPAPLHQQLGAQVFYLGGLTADPDLPSDGVCRVWYRVDLGELRCRIGGTTYTLAPPTGGGSSKLLSATHTDTVAADPVQDDIIVANATPAWTKLNIGAQTLVGRITGGHVAALTVAQVKTLLAYTVPHTLGLLIPGTVDTAADVSAKVPFDADMVASSITEIYARSRTNPGSTMVITVNIYNEAGTLQTTTDVSISTSGYGATTGLTLSATKNWYAQALWKSGGSAEDVFIEIRGKVAAV